MSFFLLVTSHYDQSVVVSTVMWVIIHVHNVFCLVVDAMIINIHYTHGLIFAVIHHKDVLKKNISDCIRQVKLTSKFDKIFGIISRSPLSSVLSMPDQVPFDYFHLCFEIHTPLIMKHWMKFLSKECKQRIDQYLSHISYLIRSIDILKQSLIFLNGKRAK